MHSNTCARSVVPIEPLKTKNAFFLTGKRITIALQLKRLQRKTLCDLIYSYFTRNLD